MKCQYSKPCAKPPFKCEKEATESIDFGVAKANVCGEHYTRFWEEIYPFLNES